MIKRRLNLKRWNLREISKVMSTYVVSDERGECQMCHKKLKGSNKLYVCSQCNFKVCAGCLAKGPLCRCANGVPPLNDEQQGKMNMLMDMGFPDYICYHALVLYKWDVNGSIPWIISNLPTFPPPAYPDQTVQKSENGDLITASIANDDRMRWRERSKVSFKTKKTRHGKLEENRDDEWYEDVFDDELYDCNSAPDIKLSTKKCYEVIEANDIIKMITSV